MAMWKANDFNSNDQLELAYHVSFTPLSWGGICPAKMQWVRNVPNQCVGGSVTKRKKGKLMLGNAKQFLP